jgi:hypothetical protein
MTMQRNVKSPGLLRVTRTIMWSFFGVRNSKRHAEDTADLSLHQVAVAGVIGGTLFVLTLLAVVNYIVP